VIAFLHKESWFLSLCSSINKAQTLIRLEVNIMKIVLRKYNFHDMGFNKHKYGACECLHLFFRVGYRSLSQALNLHFLQAKGKHPKSGPLLGCFPYPASTFFLSFSLKTLQRRIL